MGYDYDGILCGNIDWTCWDINSYKHKQNIFKLLQTQTELVGNIFKVCCNKIYGICWDWDLFVTNLHDMMGLMGVLWNILWLNLLENNGTYIYR